MKLAFCFPCNIISNAGSINGCFYLQRENFQEDSMVLWIGDVSHVSPKLASCIYLNNYYNLPHNLFRF